MSTVAVIGSGISGLGVAYLLNPSHDVTVYEKNASVGGHTRTVTVDYNNNSIPVDSGFIVYNERNYPHLTGLFRHLNVPVQKSNMTFGISIDRGRLEWGADSPNAVFGQRGNILKPAFWRMLFDIVRFNRGAVAFMRSHPEVTLGELVRQMNLGDWFQRYYLLPMGGAIWSCPPSQMLAFPASTFVRFFDNHGLLTVTQQPQWYTVTGGSQEYVKRLTPSFEHKIKVNCGIRAVQREQSGVMITDTNGVTQRYDHVIFACHADQALNALTDATPEEKAALGAIRYQKNRAVLHRDASFMPVRKRCWSSWVYHVEGKEDERDIGITYWMNLLQSIDNAYPLFVTLNPAREPAKGTVFDDHLFEHPVFTQEAIAAQGKIEALQGQGNIWYCGAHLRYGFHEDGLLSAVNVAQKLGAPIPWL